MKRSCFNHDWLFWPDRGAFSLVWSIPESARRLSLPHDAMLESPVRSDSPNGRNTGFRDGGNYCYVKHFYCANPDLIQILYFEGVYMNASVYVNGQRIVFHPYGYTGFQARIDPFLQPGEDNEIRVLVHNSAMSNSRWYSGSGIYRDVWLYEGTSAYIAPLGVQVTTLDADENHARIKINTQIVNIGKTLDGLSVCTEIRDDQGVAVAEDVLPLSQLNTGEVTVTQEIELASPYLWSDLSPKLYTCHSFLLKEGQTIDEHDTDFGVRTIRLDPSRGLLINGQPVKLRGACVHHDHGVLGAKTYYDAEYRRVSLLKQAGFNAIRMAHHPAAPSLLRACDRLGMYVMDEAFDMWTRYKTDSDYAQFFDDWWERDLEAMSRSNYNHPSVILQSIGNEIPEIATADGLNLVQEMVDMLKRLDPTRPILAAVNGVFAAGDDLESILSDLRSQLRAENVEDWNVNDFLSAMEKHMGRIVRHDAITRRLDAVFAKTDIAGYNYMAPRYEQDALIHPRRMLVGSETYPPDIAYNWGLVQRLPQLIGDFTWTGWDYIGETGVGCPSYGEKKIPFGLGYPCVLAYCGDFDIMGFRRPLSYYREIVFGLRAAPYIAVRNLYRRGQKLNRSPWMMSDATSSWTFPNCEGKPVTVEVYSAGDQVELFVNGRSLGRKIVSDSPGCLALFEIVYEPGVLEAVSYQDGKELGRSHVATAGPVSSVAVSTWQGPEGGLVFVDVRLLDENGNINDKQDMTLSVCCRGACVLGLGSGNPMFSNDYLGTSVRTFQGRAQVVLERSAPGEGIRLNLDGEGLHASVDIPAKEGDTL